MLLWQTFYTVHGGLCYNTILLGGDERQQKEFLPKLAAFDWQGCFALTEPLSGSDIAGGLATTAERVGDKWILNGEKTLDWWFRYCGCRSCICS